MSWVCFSQADNGTCHAAEPAPTTSRSPEIRGQVSPFFTQVTLGTWVVRILKSLKSLNLLLGSFLFNVF